MFEMIWRRGLTPVLACASVAATASPSTSITVFGDSHSDGGNAYAWQELSTVIRHNSAQRRAIESKSIAAYAYAMRARGQKHS